MNGKTAKLIRKWSVATNNDPAQLKRVWKSTPRNNRGKLSTNMRLELAPDAYGYDIVKEGGKTYAVSKADSIQSSAVASMATPK